MTAYLRTPKSNTTNFPKYAEEFQGIAAAKLFRRRGKKIDTGDAVSSYGEVVSVAISDVCGRIFKAKTEAVRRNTLLRSCYYLLS